MNYSEMTTDELNTERAKAWAMLERASEQANSWQGDTAQGRQMQADAIKLAQAASAKLDALDALIEARQAGKLPR